MWAEKFEVPHECPPEIVIDYWYLCNFWWDYTPHKEFQSTHLIRTARHFFSISCTEPLWASFGRMPPGFAVQQEHKAVRPILVKTLFSRVMHRETRSTFSSPLRKGDVLSTSNKSSPCLTLLFPTLFEEVTAQAYASKFSLVLQHEVHLPIPNHVYSGNAQALHVFQGQWRDVMNRSGCHHDFFQVLHTVTVLAQLICWGLSWQRWQFWRCFWPE